MNMFIYIHVQQVAGLVLVQVICSLNATTIIYSQHSSLLWKGFVYRSIFWKKTLTFQKMVVHGHSVITQGKVILALWVVGGLGLSSDGAHSVVFLGMSKTEEGGGGALRYISVGDVQSPFWGLKFTI